jgi:hypothetical protein
MVLAGCSSHPLWLEKIAPIVIKNEGVPLFSVPAPEGRWYISSGTFQTTNSGSVYVNGVFPDPTGISQSIGMELGSTERWPDSSSDVLPILKNGNYQAYLGDVIAHRYSSTGVHRRGIKRFGGEVIKFKGLSCLNLWDETSVAPHTHEGKGIALYSTLVSCPMVKDGHVYRFSMNITTYIGAWYYNIKESYEKTKKPGDPECPSSLDELLRNQHHEDYLSSIGPTAARLFSGIQFYGKVSQNYADIENPELLQEKIAHPELYRPMARKRN